MANSFFPPRPFDGQVFIDAARVRWVFNAELRCWQRDGMETDIPLASETQPGLLSAQLKQLIDSIPPKGGHFGIVTRPLLSVVPLSHEQLLKDAVEASFKTETGSTIRSKSAIESAAFEEDIFAGKLLRFLDGILRNNAFLVSGNTDTDIRLIGNANAAATNDKFEIVEPTALNLSGIIAGNVELVSESIDIACVDRNDEPIPDDCKAPVNCEGDDKPPALDFKVSDLFKTIFCAQQPGCEGPRGKKGITGDDGKDGTGDGPQGEQGDPGGDAPDTPVQLDGIKIVDIDDIFDTAVVSIEVDAENGRLNVVKAKVRTPADDLPADQLIATEVFRELDFTGNGFEYNIARPPTDPLPKADADLTHYPQGFGIPTGVSGKRPESSTVHIAKLSTFLNEMAAFWQNKLNEIDAEYNRQLKAFIEGKDREARLILAQLCQELSDCEWERPIEFCLGIAPNDCLPDATGAAGGAGGGGEAAPAEADPLSLFPSGIFDLGPSQAVPIDAQTIAGGLTPPALPATPSIDDLPGIIT